MATSLLGRASLPRVAWNYYKSLYSLHLRLFSSKQTGKDSDISSDLDQTKELKSKHDAVSVDGPVTDRTSAGASPSEGAVDKFFKIVEKVKKSQEVKLDSGSKQDVVRVEEDPNESFATMLRKSKLVSLGDVGGRLVQGNVIEVMEDDLYIDFGGKFHCVCPRPKLNPELYHRGTKVLVSLQALEMSSAFLGSDIHITLLEADGTLLGLESSHRPRRKDNLTSTVKSAS